MKDRSLTVAVLTGVLAGTVVGAGTFYSAQVVSYRYSDFGTSREEARTKEELYPRAQQRIFGGQYGAAPRNTEDTSSCDIYLNARRRMNCIQTLRENRNQD